MKRAILCTQTILLLYLIAIPSCLFSQANVLVGKSFTNITRPNGGTIIPGDELEIRLSVFVYQSSASAAGRHIFRLRYNDTIPANLNYVPGTLKLLTNESKVYKAYTDLPGDDFAMYDGTTKTVRFNLGRDTTNHPTGNVLTTGTDTLVNGGGYVRTDTHAPKGGGGSLGNGILVLVTYHVTVDAATSYNTIITYGSGMIRYRNQIFGGSSTELSQYPNKLSFIIYPNNGMCSNATGVNYVAAGNGNFGSGTTQNGPNPGLAVPGYSFINISTSNPGDGSYSVVKNLSPSENTNATIARPQSPSTDRVFGVWDIIGDHTSAVDPIAGNAPVANGANGGYMLAVNSALQLSVANNQTITSLCEDTYYEFSAWFRNVCKRCGSDSLGRGASQLSVPVGYIPTGIGDSSGVKPNLTFQIDGVDYYLSGNLDYTGTWGEWVKKGFVFKTGIGQTSLTISIKNNAPGGGGNDWVMDDISFASCLPGLNMRPGPAPSYCINGQVRLSAIVTTYYNNYQYYQWERSTDGGANWTAAPELPGIQTFSYAYDGLNYTDSVAIPSFLANTSYNGYLYRIKVATSTANLATNSCSIYQGNTIAITVNSSCIVLDVNLLQFQGQVSNKKSVLTWQAKADQNPHNFEIERSDDGIQFTKIGAVTGSQNGLTNQYNFTDPEVLSGKKFYRLKIVIQGGANSKFSEIISLAEGSAGKLVLKSLVNPFNSLLQFQIESPEADKIRVDLFDTYGKLVFSVPTAIRKGNNPVSIETLGFLSKGTYILRIKSSKEVINRTIQSL